ncbi:hypothetical protein DICPUDRAFT_149652 [Dictyostelium purpureum]|uniref:Uncharacterized protein n=1 Tax=Dictyostelium purpureum TaxID=5786 RepID=F0ZEB4_DICPU|nr:uncharacterized protein DICPUDRAFT_149652 [Dictyostelium purpureum]EGC37726.1 hypothetical protein DICPUDRAFT_149652 [Dictyostelium purpureum]|eukprot:XP_003285747.1 hypothetical protein DICPUDRAFT_149652 [Dictyostelium purpureum]
MNDYVVLFFQTIITLVISFLLGMVLIKYYFNNKYGNNNFNNGNNYNNNGNGNYQSNASQYSCPPHYDECIAEKRAQEQAQKKHQAIEELLYLRRQELQNQNQFNFESKPESYNDPPIINEPSNYEKKSYDQPESERETSNYPTFNKNEARHSFSDEPQSSNYTETDHIQNREPSVYPTFNQKESRHSLNKEQSPNAPPESATSPPDSQNDTNHTCKRESSNYPTFNKNESRHSFSGAPQSHNYSESQSNGANFNGEQPSVEEYDEETGEWVPYN